VDPREACHLVLAHSCSTQDLGRTFDDQESVYQVSDSVEMMSQNKVAISIYSLIVAIQLLYEACCGIWIIIIGEIDYGMIFMDCFSRVFQWENVMATWQLFFKGDE
jgi:hypothetical protein